MGIYDSSKEVNLVNLLKRLWTKAPSLDKSQMPSYYHTNPRLAPVRVIAKRAASVEAKLYMREDYRKNSETATPIGNHELYELLERPSPMFPELDGWALRYMTFAYLDLVGEFLWLKVRVESTRQIVALLPVLPAWVLDKPKVGSHVFKIYPYGVTAGAILTVPAEDVVWFKDPDLCDPYSNGRGQAEAVGDEIQTDELAAKYQKNYFNNDATPPYIVVSPNATEPVAKQIKESLAQTLSGWMNARKPAVIGGKDTQVIKMGETAKEMDMVESRKFIRDLSNQNWQIPPEIMGDISNSNRATIDAADFLFNKGTIAPRIEFYERQVNAQLVGPDFGPDIVLKHEKVVQEDKEFKLKIFNEGLEKGTVLVDEWRAQFGLPPMPNGAGQVSLRAYSTISVPAGDSGVAAPAPIPKEEPVAALEEDPKKSVFDHTGRDIVLEIIPEAERKMEVKTENKRTEAQRTKIWTIFDAKASSVEPLFKRAVKKFSAIQQEKVKEAVKSAVRADKTEEAIEKALKAQFNSSSDNAVKSALAPSWLETMKLGKENALEALGKEKSVKQDPMVSNALFNRWVERFGLMKAKEINTTTFDKLNKNLRAQLSEAIEQGESINNTIKRLMETCEGVYTELDSSRAEMIARTESATSMNYGSYATYKIEGVGKKEWISTRDDRTREAHIELDGTVVDMDEKFIADGEELDFPGDPSGSAEQVINCRCTIAPVIDE